MQSLDGISHIGYQAIYEDDVLVSASEQVIDESSALPDVHETVEYEEITGKLCRFVHFSLI